MDYLRLQSRNLRIITKQKKTTETLTFDLKPDTEEYEPLRNRIEPCEFSFTIDSVEYEFNRGCFFKKITKFEPGFAFGDIALKTYGKRTASIKVYEKGQFATLNKLQYEKCLNQVQLEEKH